MSLLLESFGPPLVADEGLAMDNVDSALAVNSSSLTGENFQGDNELEEEDKQ